MSERLEPGTVLVARSCDTGTRCAQLMYDVISDRDLRNYGLLGGWLRVLLVRDRFGFLGRRMGEIELALCRIVS